MFLGGRCAFLGLTVLLSWPIYSLQGSILGQRSLPQLTATEILSLASSSDPVKNIDTHDPNSHLSRILIPRAAGSENSTFVRNYIKSALEALNWHVEEDTFTDNTPYGPKSFTNVIATKDPAASRRVIVSAHFDSKFFPSYPEDQFIGATDSAAPCAMMLDLAEALNPLLEHRTAALQDGIEDDDDDMADTTLQLVFFDGEEAFKDWTDTDSVYGARHLAQRWSTSYIAPHSKRRLLSHGSETEISTIEHLILLDLLGAARPSVRSYFSDTAWLFDAMASAERRLAESGAFTYSGDSATSWPSFFIPRTAHEFSAGYIGDDHVPFLHKGVNILHVIPAPFPHVWHTLKDDASALDIPTMRRWNLILRVLMAEYLNLRPNSASKHERIQRADGELVREQGFCSAFLTTDTCSTDFPQ
ncbi:hypothetical protein BJ138DRAFT_1136942 [Hygrophoropsis aurantiaca]|uniref:Uncharacterized protein n=1 Tax=Hygrophoropsis aurantiaca TaxID=72124 RepID=A0ACB8A7S0_9AGAM|nr:hypothetical protein BJ138DRAFT_1136942 [Hygrophoropsis aurantiaca]